LLQTAVDSGEGST